MGQNRDLARIASLGVMMSRILRAIQVLVLLLPVIPGAALAQDNAVPLQIVTVEREPFSMQNGDHLTGFSIDLMQAIAEELGRKVHFQVAGSFPEMLDTIVRAQADGAIANISITAEREKVLDFSQPIFDSGIQIMIPSGKRTQGGIWQVLLRRDVALLIGVALLALTAAGMLMWALERHKQDYFAHPARRAIFPAFWWALNLVVNGGFEERLPQTRLGRAFAVVLVVSSLFLVSIFVARITSELTVQAISANITGLNDLDGKAVGTTRGSTSSAFLNGREIAHQEYDSLDSLFAAFESGQLDAVAFDAPVLAYYVKTRGRGKAELLPQTFKHENYGIALPAGSPLIESINRALLTLRENGTYDSIRLRWFGNAG